MVSLKSILKILPWLILIVIIFTLYLTNHWPFGKKEKQYQHIIESSVILDKIETLGKLELTKYNFKEVFEYKRLSDGKIIGNSILQTHDYDPDISVILVASGEAVGCLDLTKLNINDISIRKDTVIIQLPAPELCYHKLNLEDTKIYSLSKESWWSKIFSDDNEKEKILHVAYQQAEKKLKEAAIKSGIYQSTNENVITILKPILEQLTDKKLLFNTTIPTVELTPNR